MFVIFFHFTQLLAHHRTLRFGLLMNLQSDGYQILFAGWSCCCFKTFVWKMQCWYAEGNLFARYKPHLLYDWTSTLRDLCELVLRHFYLVFNNQKLAHCLALLPKSRGDEDSWSLMIQKILFLLNGHLNDVFQGLEEGRFECNLGSSGFCLKTCEW